MQSKSKISSQRIICFFRMRTDQLIKITQEEAERLKKEEVLGELNIGIEIVTRNPPTPHSTNYYWLGKWSVPELINSIYGCQGSSWMQTAMIAPNIVSKS